MAPLVVEGKTLIEKYQSYNKIVKESTQVEISNINYEESDFDNFYKIDIASKNRNVDYILKVFKSEDMLYVFRAIKQSTWLITDQQYTHIINSIYLHDELYSNMVPKAFKKLLLNVRLNLKDEVRAEEFFTHYKDKDFQLALKWLPLCSVNFTVNIIMKDGDDIPDQMMKRLCEKSVLCLEAYTHVHLSDLRIDVFSSTNYLLKNNMTKYLDVIESCDSHHMPRFGKRTTKFITKKDPERVMNNLHRYCRTVHRPTLARCIKREDMKDFILTNKEIRYISFLFIDYCIKPFIDRLPLENKFDFIKDELINNNKKYDLGNNDVFHPSRVMPAEIRSEIIYRWYKFAPFDTAFEDLKKLIRSESDPTERAAMIEILLTRAGDDMENINTLLKYYRHNCINESIECKSRFVELVLTNKNTYRFNKGTWESLNDIYTSLNNKSDKLVQLQIRSIMLHKIIRKEIIPDHIEQKFIFDTFKTYRKKLSDEEKEEIFSYLYKLLTYKINNLVVNNEIECIDIVDLLRSVSNLLVDCNKELSDFTIILYKIKEVVQIIRKNNFNIDITGIYKRKKSWKKLLLAESILLCPTQEACIDALKFGPELLQIYEKEIAAICLDKPIKLFLKNIRVFCSEQLNNTYKDLFLSKICDNIKQKTAIERLFTLLPRNEVLNIVQKYALTDANIDWKSPNSEVSICKNIALNLRLVRPLPSPEVVLLFARRGYLRYALPSLNTIFDNITRSKAQGHIVSILDSPVSLQKHGIRYAFNKLQPDEIHKTFSVIWKSSTNVTIRMHIFDKILDYLCNTRVEVAIKEMSELLGVVIDNLSFNESKRVYNRLSRIEKIPMSVRPKIWMKSFKFMKSMPAKGNCDILLGNLINSLVYVAEGLDDDIVAEIFFDNFDKKFSTREYEYQCIVALYLLSTKTEEAHITRYTKILVPILERSFSMWNQTHEDINYVQYNLLSIFKYLDKNFEETVLDKQMILPIPLYTDILVRLQTKLRPEENYVMITSRKLALDCVKIFDEVLKSKEEFKFDNMIGEDERNVKRKLLFNESTTKLGKIWINYLKEDIEIYFPSIYVLFAQAIEDIFRLYFYRTWYKVRALKPFLENKDFIYGHLLITKLLPLDHYGDEEKNFKIEILEDLRAHPSKEVRMQYRFLLSNMSL